MTEREIEKGKEVEEKRKRKREREGKTTNHKSDYLLGLFVS